MEIPTNLKNEIWEYCRANNITNIDEFTLKLVKQGFTVEKFGATPGKIEKIVEKLVEVPVEKIVEKLVEVTVEKIVEKEIFITDNSEIKVLTDKIKELTDEEKSCREANIMLQETLKMCGEEKHKLKVELAEEKNKKKTDLYGEN